MRLSYPTGIRIIRVPCSGKVDIIHILRALEKGADGVCVFSCMDGDCHFKTGNFRARKRVEQAQKLLDTIGTGGERVQMYSLGSGDGPPFAKYAAEMYEKVKALGPNPIKKHKQKQDAA